MTIGKRREVRVGRPLGSVTVAGFSLCLLSWGGQAHATPRIPVGRVSLSVESVERSTDGRFWTDIEDGTLLRTGERVRSGEASLARFAIGWASLVLGPNSEIAIPASSLLSIELERGRIEERSEGADIVKIRTAECLIRGKGYVIVRRSDEATAVSARLGRFRVQAGGRTVSLEPGTGTLVRSGRGPLARLELAPAPAGIAPGPDPVYIDRGAPVRLEWSSRAAAHWLELIAVGTEAVVLQREVGTSPAQIAVPWPGTYRWRVSARDALGIDGQPSRSGLICVPGW